MQLQIKTLSNEKFTVDCELTDTVRSVKEKIAAKDLKDKYEADAVKLIFSGKILEDNKTLESYSITTESFLVVVKQTVSKPAAASSSTPPTTNTQTASSSSTGTSSTNPTARSATATQPATATAQPAAPTRPAQPAQPAQPAAVSQDSFLSPEAREAALKELVDMGFERSQAELALRASYYHVERAAEYLITGEIPRMPEAAATRPTGGATQPATNPESGRAPGVEDLAELSNNPQFQALRQLIQQNPDQLQTLMQTLQQTQPELFQLIEQRPQEFLEMLNQVDEGDDDDDQMQGIAESGGAGGQGQVPPGAVPIVLSPQDQQAINRLQDMGFERYRVIEAFLACDRNEELAANYLLSSFD